MCSAAVRLRGTDRWPFRLAPAGSRQPPILSVWMIVLGPAKTNSPSTRGPNQPTDPEPRGHARRLLSICLGKREAGWRGVGSISLQQIPAFVSSPCLKCFVSAGLHPEITHQPLLRASPRPPPSWMCSPVHVGGALLRQQVINYNSWFSTSLGSKINGI